MKQRTLPLMEDGDFRGRYTLLAICYLVYPENEQDARRSFEVLSAENDDLDAGRAGSYGEIGSFVLKRIHRRMSDARIAGQVLYQMINNKRLRGSNDYRKALFVVSEWASVTRTAQGKGLASDGRNLHRRVKDFASALHYWAAFELLTTEDQQQVFSSSPAFTRWMVTAAAIQKAVFDLEVDRSEGPLADWKPWLVPPLYDEVLLRGDFVVLLPEETGHVRERLQQYRAKPFENPR